jgi:hypothetical protein
MNRRRNSWQPVSGEGYKTKNLAVFITATEKKVTLRSKENKVHLLNLTVLMRLAIVFIFTIHATLVRHANIVLL